MTEAIRTLKVMKERASFSDVEKAIEKGIEALEEVEQYRVLGTVEEIIKHRENLEQENHEYSCIGTVEELKEAREKQVAKKPILISDGDSDGIPVYDIWECPNCGEHYEVEYDDYDYCPNCGQAIDKSEIGRRR